MNDLLLIKPTRFSDHRGFFSETYSYQRYSELGIKCQFLQDNHSLSHAIGTLRGLHFQSPPMAQAKLVRCGRGAIFDVAVDIRRGSASYGQWKGYTLTAENGYQLYIPIGFAHGFLTLETDSEIVYKCTNYYAVETEGVIHWNSCGIDWPLLSDPILNNRDATAPSLTEFVSPFLYGANF